jgi:hypothetical protein
MRLGNENLAMRFGGFQATKIEDMDLINLASKLREMDLAIHDISCKNP